MDRKLVCRLSSGFTVKSTYRGLKKAWIGLRIAQREGNHEKVAYYTEGIQKFEKQLGLTVTNFLDILKEEAKNSQESTECKSS